MTEEVKTEKVKTEKVKNLAELKLDLEKANRDLINLQRQQFMVQGIIAYLTQEIQKLGGE